MGKIKKKGKKVVFIGSLYDDYPQDEGDKDLITKSNHVDMGKFLLSIPKDLRRSIKFESDEKGFKNASAYICHILFQRHLTFTDSESE